MQVIEKKKYVNPRTLVKIENNQIIINEDDLDLFSYPDYELPEWQPKITLPPYSELSTIFIDIETTGGVVKGQQYPDTYNHDIELIGIQNEKGTSIIINCLQKPINVLKLIDNLNLDYLDKNPGKSPFYSLNNVCVINAGSESCGLQELLDLLNKKNPDIIAGYNCFSFDLRFIVDKLDKHKLRNPFWVNPNPTKFTTAQKWGQPSIYNGIWYNTYPKGKTTIFDLYHQLLSWDFVARKLTSFSLKQGVLQTKLRKEERLELSYEEMRKTVSRGDIETYAQYLLYDLEDTKILGDFLIPSVYYQKLFLPNWKLQSISHAGNGSKWNDILKQHYIRKNQPLPETSPKMIFQGGLTGANAGLYFNVSKIDVGSLYPNIMLTYCICSEKDEDKYQLILLKYLLNFRLNLKEKKKQEIATSEEIRTEGSFKVKINSAFGGLGTSGIEFNDYVAASLVTAHGRAILKLMVDKIIEFGGVICSIDTDGVYYSTTDATFQLNSEIHKKVQDCMPKGINLDYELEARCFYVPPNTVKKISSELITGTDEEQPGIRNDGLKKNYIIISDVIDKRTKQPTGELQIKSKGKYVKRDRCILEKEFQPEIVKLLNISKNAAYEYYQSIISEMKLGIYNIDNLRITRTIRKGEVEVIEQGLGNVGDQISYYFAEPEIQYGKRGQPLKNKKMVRTLDGVPGWSYYIEMVNAMFNEIWQFVN